jgi:hypothetical protein
MNMIHEYLQQDTPIEEDLCFVIMPFGKDMDHIYANGIKPAIESLDA